MNILDEKIKIRISKFLRHEIEECAYDFYFIKQDDEPNLNAFLNKLIPNLLKLKKLRREKIYEYAQNTFNVKKDFSKKAEEIINSLNAIYDDIYFSDNEEMSLTENLWIRPTKESIASFDEIIDNEVVIAKSDCSTYIRNLLTEFIRLPVYKQEQIVFSQECEIILEAYFKQRILKFRYNNQLKHVYIFSCLIDQSIHKCNYVLCYDIKLKLVCSYRVPEIVAPHVLLEKYTPTDEVMDICNNYRDNALWIDDEVVSVGE